MKTLKKHLLDILLFICLAVSVTTTIISNNNFKRLQNAYIELNKDYSKLEKYKALDDTLNIQSLRDSEVKIEKLIKYSNSKLFNDDINEIYFTLLTSSLQLTESNVYLYKTNHPNIEVIKHNEDIKDVIDRIIKQ